MKKRIKAILQALDNKDPAVLSMENKTLDLLDGKGDVLAFIYEIREEVRVANLIHNDRQPFYYIYSAIAHWMNKETGKVQSNLANASQGFRISGVILNEALVEWLFGIIHFENGKPLRAQQACEISIALMQQLIKQCEEESKYEKAKKYLSYLSEVENFKETVKTFGPAQDKQGSDFKVILQKYHDELKNTFDNLKMQGAKIPPTLVASIFYAYKILAPSHSVYSKVPDPANKNEEMLYAELLRKVGFFEIIEQLVELEDEFKPTATREELLELINQEWDENVE